MFLISITNLDYLMMSILFAVFLGIAYWFRRANPSSNDFLLSQNKGIARTWLWLSLISVGLIEFTAISSVGAYVGLSALVVVPIFLIFGICLDYRLERGGLIGILIAAKPSNVAQRLVLFSYALIALLAAGVVTAIMVKLFKSLLGWEFANSTLALVGLIAVCLLLGGMISVIYNHVLALIVSSLVFLVVIIIGTKQIGGIAQLIHNLQHVALNNKLALNYFINLDVHNYQQLWFMLVMLGVILILNPLFWIKARRIATSNVSLTSSARFMQAIILGIMALIGVLALATPNTTKHIINGGSIINQQTRLSDGSLGYLIKVVPTNQPDLTRGIIPKQMTQDNQIDSLDSANTNFDFLNAALVMVRHCANYAFISLFLLVALFFKSLSELTTFSTLVSIRGFYAPYFNKTGDELENLWASRVCLFKHLVLAICLGLVFYKFFDVYYILAGLSLLIMPLLMNLLGFSRSYLIDALAYVLLLSSFLLVDIENVPSVYPVFKFISLWDYLSVASASCVVFYVISFCGLKLVRRNHE